MKRISLKTMMIMLLIFSLLTPAVALQVKHLGWKDLISKFEFDDPFEALTDDQLSDLGMVARIRQKQEMKREVGDATLEEVKECVSRLELDGIDIDGLLAKRKEIMELRSKRANAVVEDLNGQQVSMPGFALPLEFSGKQITEFLLVPWVGACIHTPPPPPNQIVYVKLEKGMENRGRYTPVVVTGEMAVKPTTKNLYLVDGSSGIDIGYTLQAGSVVPYEK